MALPRRPRPRALRLAQAAIDGWVHAVTFTAAPAVTGLFAMAAAARLDAPLRAAFNERGVVAVIGEERVKLNSRERALLDTLAARPGTVFSRPALIRRVWTSTGADPHAVEVAIARLRPRLGPAGAALVTVPGRGYRLDPPPSRSA